jgi:hypothetical protein
MLTRKYGEVIILEFNTGFMFVFGDEGHIFVINQIKPPLLTVTGHKKIVKGKLVVVCKPIIVIA